MITSETHTLPHGHYDTPWYRARESVMGPFGYIAQNGYKPLEQANIERVHDVIQQIYKVALM